MWIAILFGALFSFPNDGVMATRAVMRALTQDPFAGASKVGACKATSSNSRMKVQRTYYNSSSSLGSNFSNLNIMREPKLFYLEMISEEFNNNSSNWFRLRVGQGGQIYSLTGAYGEAMPPNMNINQPFVNDVLQSVVYPKNNLRKINQAGASIYYPQNSDLRGIPFWSPNSGADPFGENISSPDAAIDCAGNSCRVISWGQPNALTSRQGSSALFYSQYSNCGAGVIEITSFVHNMADSPSIKSISKHNATVFGDMSIPEIHVRNSTFEEIYISDSSNFSASLLKTRPYFISSDSITLNLSKTDGYTIFSRGVNGKSGQALTSTADTFADSPAIAVVHGTLSDNKSWESSYLRLGQDLPLENDALKMVVQHLVNVSPGETFVRRYFILNDALNQLKEKDKTRNWANSTYSRKFRVQDALGSNQGRGSSISLVRYGLHDSFYVSMLDSELQTCAWENATMTSCRGYSVPRANHYAYFYIHCGLGQYYTGPDRYHFTPPLNTTNGILKPYLCNGFESDSSVRPKITLLGFFPDDGSCDGLRDMTYKPELCLSKFEKMQSPSPNYISIAPQTTPSMSPTVPSFPTLSHDICGANYQSLINETKFATLYQLANDGVSRYNEAGYIDATDVLGANPYNFTSQTGVTFLIKPVYYNALPWKGKCTRVYAWLSLPFKGQILNPVPAAVLLHGGGGTAFKAWCEEWALRDMASIAIALEGQTDVRLPQTDAWERHQWAGPWRVGRAYSDSILPQLSDQWMYHAVADTIIANNLLRNEKSVNPEQIGVTGVSWGGVITSTVIGFDQRFAFAISGYGCGSLAYSLGHLGTQMTDEGQEVINAYNSLWDPLIRFSNITKSLPTLWISSPQDGHFPMIDQSDTYKALMAAPGAPQVLTVLIPNLGHGHGPIWNRSENYEFAKSVLSSSDRRFFAKQIGQQEQTLDSGETEAAVWFESTKTFTNATLVSSTGSVDIASGNRIWTYEQLNNLQALEHYPCADHLDPNRCVWFATAVLPRGTTSWYINFCTHKNIICVSSYYNELSPQLQN